MFLDRPALPLLSTQEKIDLKLYLVKNFKKYVRPQILRIRQRTKILSSEIYIGKIVTEMDNTNIRELIEGNYRIIYLIVNVERIDILTVHHSA
jgi:plasmid stabilization system protein ParE